MKPDWLLVIEVEMERLRLELPFVLGMKRLQTGLASSWKYS